MRKDDAQRRASGLLELGEQEIVVRGKARSESARVNIPDDAASTIAVLPLADHRRVSPRVVESDRARGPGSTGRVGAAMSISPREVPSSSNLTRLTQSQAPRRPRDVEKAEVSGR